MTREKRKLLLKFLKRWTKYEILARHAPFGFPENADHSFKMIEMEDKIRLLLYGSCCLPELGEKWGILTPRKRKKVKRETNP